ncbi:hypothetical protein HJC23_009298 [Cyclotella cryptica]|uniref:L domain-like protein n=1 Tax=Cyclotella cryptica TaxID=29204 RepID=A0ABD3QSG3_9STRA
MKKTLPTLVPMVAIFGSVLNIEARQKKMLRNEMTRYNKMNRVEYNAVQMEDVMFWMRHLEVASLPQRPKPTLRPTSSETPVPNPLTSPSPSSVLTSFPTLSGGTTTTFPTYGFNGDGGVAPDSSFNCPPASFVGCTAPNPNDPVDECPTVGMPCKGGNEGEFCCRDACPRNYCTAKEFVGGGGDTPAPTFFDTTESTPAPTLKPTAKPTPAPTFPCNITPDTRVTQLTNILATVSKRVDFNTANSPQNLALNWILNEDLALICPSNGSVERQAIIQRYVMALFYYSTNGNDPVNNPTWKECAAPNVFNQASVDVANNKCKLTTTNSTQIFPDDVRGTNAWLTPESECTWGGVSCYPESSSDAGKVNAIELENNGVQGNLPFELEQLNRMRWFSSERGSLSGPIPSTIGNLDSLLLLDMDFNKLSGPLPESLWSLTQLRQLDLNDNEFTGTLSASIGDLSELRFFQIDNNKMIGTIPDSLGDASNFGLIGLSGNGFTGAMPSSVCELRPSPLQTLVADCSIECSVPDCCTSCVP